MKSFLVAIVSGVVCVSLWQWLSDDKTPVVPSVQVVKEYVIAPASPNAEPEVSAPLNTNTTASGAPVGLPVPVAHPLGRKLAEMKDVKAFVIEALKQPENGGAYYAALALEQCGDDAAELNFNAEHAIRNVVASESTISQQRLKAIRGATERCVGFTDGDIQLYKNQILSLRKSDPLFKLSMARDGTKPGPERDAAVDAIYLSKNAALISSRIIPNPYMQKAVNWSDPANPTIRFNGQTYVKEEMQAIMLASTVGVCIEGDYCAVDLWAQKECWNSGTCYASREDYLRQKFFKNDPAGFDKMNRYAEQVRSAMLRGDRSIFQ